MIDAISYSNIVKKVRQTHEQTLVRAVCFDSVDPVSEAAMAKINSKIKKHSLVGVLFSNPKTSFCKQEILDNLNYFHHRSKHHINIFCCGYGAYWNADKYPDLQVETAIDGAEWSYSDCAFVNLVEEFEARTKWQYSGENELLILDVSPSQNEDELSINSAVICNLEKMKNDKAFSSVRSFIEKLIRYAASSEASSAWVFSDQQGVNVGKDFLKDSILSLLPTKLQSSYNKAEHFAVRKI
ncbi:hypothetical protein D5E75_22955 [Vibrio parahaemolyticus]|nr:hypothetical protein D5E75_22955 [Vibrio parahaemolyticus]